MSKPFNPDDLFDHPDRAHEDFGRDEGFKGYQTLVGRGFDPDKTVGEIAERAIRLKMIVEGRFDVDVRKATAVTVHEVIPEGLQTEDIDENQL